MQDFRDKVAVIKGAASEIGRALAEHCIQEGAKVVLADTEEPALLATAHALQAQGGVVLPVRTLVPLMLEQETEGHLVNTAAMVGVISYEVMPPIILPNMLSWRFPKISITPWRARAH